MPTPLPTPPPVPVAGGLPGIPPNPLGPPGDTTWYGDPFCSPDWRGADCAGRARPWSRTGCVRNGPSLRNVPSPVDGRGRAGRFEVRNGDRGAPDGGDRCEIVQQTRS